MGNVENVIVVTAYEDSSTPFPHLRRDSNYSLDGLVHIAGPGGEIPSTISNGKYVATGGTSEAAAFVAGVASAMVSLYPTYYPTAEKVKFRLQITASQEVKEKHGEIKRLGPGIIDDNKNILSADDRNYKLSQLRDILLSGDAHEVVECR